MQTSYDDIASRLRATRLALGLNSQTFAKRAGIHQSAYSQYENGRRLPTATAALAMCRAHRLTMDWIFLGDPSGLPHGLALRLSVLLMPTSRYADNSDENRPLTN